MPKVMLGYGLPDAPDFYKNFIRAHRHLLPIPMTKDSINDLLSKEPCKVVLRRRLRGDEQDGKVFVLKLGVSISRSDHWGQWYLDFPSKSDHMIFRMRWE